MANSIESRIVTMKFDNTGFARGVQSTLDMLGKLKAGVTGMATGTSKSIADINKTAAKVDLSPVAAGANGVSNAFIAMSTVAVTALATITHKAIEAGAQMANSLTLGPIQQGLSEYETNLNSIQTVMANTGLEGDKGLGKVNQALAELNRYSDKTIYNFSEMARNIGTFTAAGVDLDTSTAAIKGIANLAAISGSNSNQASTAMYQLSQALATGRVSLMDWNSVVNAGMGGKVFQESLKETARVHGVAIDDIIKSEGSFRDSLQTGWLSSDILTETLSKFTGDLNAEQLKQMGYTQEQIKEILKLGQTAKDAATKVKTASQLINTLQETATSGWAKTWQLIFGDFNEAKEMWTNANNVLGSLLTQSAKNRNQMFREWNKLGGRDVMIEAVSNAFEALLAILRPVRDAWRDVFPATTGQGLLEITEAIRDFTASLIIGDDTADGIRSTLRGLFAVLSIGFEIFKGLIRYVWGFFDLLAGGSGGVLDLTGSIGDLLWSLQQWLVEGGKIDDFFDKVIAGRAAIFGPIIAVVSDLLSLLAKWVTIGADVAIDALADAMVYLAPIIEDVANYLEAAGKVVQGEVVDGFEALLPVLEEVGDAILDAFGSLSGAGSAVGSAFGGLAGLFDMGDTAETAQAGIDGVKGALEGTGPAAEAAGEEVNSFGEFLGNVATFLLEVAKATGQAIGALWDLAWGKLSDFRGSAGDIFGAITDFFGLIKDFISGALEGLGLGDVLALINTGFFMALYFTIRSFVKRLSGVAKAIEGMYDSIGGTFKQVTSNLKTMQTDVRSNIILKIAGAIALLAVSLYILSKIPKDDLKKGLTAVTVMLTELVAALAILEKTTTFAGAAQMAILSVALIALGVGLASLAGAVALFGSMDVDTLKQGLITIGAILLGFTAIAALLAYTGGAVALVAAAAAILVMAAALIPLAGAIKLYAKMDTGDVFEGLGKIFAALITLAIGLTAMVVALPGAAAVVVASVALIMLAGALATMAALDWGTVGKGLAVLAATVLALSVMAAFSPLIAALGASILILGVAMLAAGAGMFLFGTGLALVAAAGLGAIAVLTAGVIAFVELLPLVIQQLGLAMQALGQVLVEYSPELMHGMSVLLDGLLQVIIDNTPKYGKMIGLLVKTGLQVLRGYIPEFIKTGLSFIISLLQGVANAMPSLVRSAVNVVVAFITAVGNNAGRMADAGFKALIKFIDGITKAIDANHEELTAAVGRLGASIVSALVSAIGQGMEAVKTAAKNLAQSAVDAAIDIIKPGSPSKTFTKLAATIPAGMAKGMDEGLPEVKNSANRVATTALETMKATLSNMSSDVNGVMDVSPVVTPILDLTNLQNESAKIGGLLTPGTISAGVSYGEALDIAADMEAAAEAEAEAGNGGGDVYYEQNNYSPKALSPREIHRNTRNQLAMKRKELEDA